MKLLSMRVNSAHPGGWSSRELQFGAEITQLFGPNGCGKTPLIQALVYALGYPVTFRDDLSRNCGSVSINADRHGVPLAIRREIGRSTQITVLVGSEERTFHNEADFSRFMFYLWNMNDPSLTTTTKKASQLYLAHVLPLFYIDQDHGYSRPYFAPNQFIQDQYTEVVRAAFHASPRNPFGRRALLNNYKDRLDQADRDIVRSENLISELLAEIGTPRRSPADVEGELNELTQTLRTLMDGSSVRDEAVVSLEEERRAISALSSTLRRERDDINHRIKGLSQIGHEIEIEANTLSLNDSARQLFASFGSICAKDGCGLFLGSSAAYGKSLLYLRDQLKDLEKLRVHQEERLHFIEDDIRLLQERFIEIDRRLADARSNSEVTVALEFTARTTERVINLKRDRQYLDGLDEEERKYIFLLADREKISNQLASMATSGGGTDLHFLSIRKELADGIARWLDVLRTANVSRDVAVDTDLSVTFGGESLKQLKGSTLIRAVLAIRTATFELMTKDPSFSPRFLILDTPRQQDIVREDIARYLAELKRMSARQDVQVVFSGSNYRYPVAERDKEWQPDFSGEDQSMFLGVDE